MLVDLLDIYRSEACSITYIYICVVCNFVQYNQIHHIKVQLIYKLDLEEVRYSVHAVLLAKVPILPLATSGILWQWRETSSIQYITDYINIS